MMIPKAKVVEVYGMNMPAVNKGPDLTENGIVWGKNSTDIGETSGSLLNLPVRPDNTENHELIVSLPPKRLPLSRFWLDLVINQDVSLIVNLCKNVGDVWTWDQECARYWPSYDEETMADANVSITLGNV